MDQPGNFGDCGQTHRRRTAIGNADDEREDEEPPSLWIAEGFQDLRPVIFLGLRGVLKLLRPQGSNLLLSRGQELGR